VRRPAGRGHPQLMPHGANTPGRSPGSDRLNNRITGCHGLRSASGPRRQSRVCGSTANVGRPAASAGCATAASHVCTTSRLAVTATLLPNVVDLDREIAIDGRFERGQRTVPQSRVRQRDVRVVRRLR